MIKLKDFFKYLDGQISAHYARDINPDPSEFKMHTHERCELYGFLGGKGIYKIEGTKYILQKGDILIMKPAESHYIEVDKAYPYTRFVINFPADIFESIDKSGVIVSAYTQRENGQFNLYRSTDFKNSSYEFYFRNMFAPSENRRLQLISNLMPLLNEISAAFREKRDESVSESDEYKIISYINRNLFKQITLDDICREFFISKPQLCRSFKAATGSTVWNYITAKRLVTAKHMIQSGQSPTKVFSECGFSDYSSFYRAYIKKHGVSPAQTHQSER